MSPDEELVQLRSKISSPGSSNSDTMPTYDIAGVQIEFPYDAYECYSIGWQCLIGPMQSAPESSEASQIPYRKETKTCVFTMFFNKRREPEGSPT